MEECMSENDHNLNTLDKTISDRGFFERLLREREKFDAERDRRLDERFKSQQIAADFAAKELARRLDVLNHAHEQAKEKEKFFVNQESYDLGLQRNDDEHKAIRTEIRASEKSSIVSQTEIQKAADLRISRLENFQSKLLGLALAAPIITALIFYLLTNRVG